MLSLSTGTTLSLRQVTVQCVYGMPTRVHYCTLSQTITVEGMSRCIAKCQALDLTYGSRIASIDFKPPFVLSGSSDKHLRLLDITTSQGWCTSPEVDANRRPSLSAGGVCEACGSTVAPSPPQLPANRQRAHQELVRSVSLNSDFVVSGSYDFTVKVWERQTGALVADLAGGHVGRIFCVGFDCSKVSSMMGRLRAVD